jgi:hypothetical protein
MVRGRVIVMRACGAGAAGRVRPAEAVVAGQRGVGLVRLQVVRLLHVRQVHGCEAGACESGVRSAREAGTHARQVEHAQSCGAAEGAGGRGSRGHGRHRATRAAGAARGGKGFWKHRQQAAGCVCWGGVGWGGGGWGGHGQARTCARMVSSWICRTGCTVRGRHARMQGRCSVERARPAARAAVA